MQNTLCEKWKYETEYLILKKANNNKEVQEDKNIDNDFDIIKMQKLLLIQSKKKRLLKIVTIKKSN